MNESQVFHSASQALSSGQFEKGLALIDPFIRLQTRNYGLWHLHALLLRKADRRAEAIKSIERAAELAPESAKIAHAHARMLFEAGLPCLQHYGRALKLAPADTELLEGMTAAFVAAGEVDAAINGLERILERSPQWVNGHALLSKLRWAEGERDDFARSYRAALDVMPGNMDLWRELIIALLHAGQWDKALSVIADGRSRAGDHPLFGANEAIAMAEIGEFEKAEELFAPFVDIEDGTVQVRRVRNYLRWGRPKPAAEIIEKWIGRPEAFMFWPYATTTWRILDDPRWEWLEGDDRFIGVYDIADRLPPLDVLAETLRKLHTLSGQPLEQSLRGGTQTDGELFTRIDPVIVKLREAIRTTVAEHAAQLPGRDPGHPLLAPPRGPIEFSGSWSVRLTSGGYHANHVHPAGWVSSALYVVLPSDLGREEAGFLSLGDPTAPNFEIDVPPLRMVEPKPGRLVLFPSYTWHGTRPFGEGERMTVAFDVAVPTGK